MRRTALALLLGCLLLVAGVSALDGYIYYQTIEYAGCDQEIYQQDIVIHRTTGTAYNETSGGLETWHIYVGDRCREDYGDVRFTNSTGAELAYYLWPDYDTTSARVTVRLEGADAAGEVTVWYGNAAAATTSDGGATFPLMFYDFEDKSLDGWTPLGGTWSAQNQILESSSLNAYIATTNQINQTELVWEYDVKVVNNAMVQVYVLAHQAASYQNQWNVVVEPTGASFWYGNSKRVAANQALPVGEMAHITLSRSPSGVWKLWQNGVYVGTTTSTTVPGRYVKVRTHWTTPATYAWDNLLVRAYSATPPAALTFSGEQENPTPPVTAFTATPSAGLTVQFTDLSGGRPTSWLWDFGDGTSSTEQNPTHTYASLGTYTVTLIATNEYGSDTHSTTLHVGYIYYQTIEYAACDQETYQQDIVIHRSTGTAYNETAGGLETWHIYVGEHCLEDYGDVRFTNSTGAELAYYLWPDYDATSARFAVRLEGADAAGTLVIHYGNPAATATSDPTVEFHDLLANPSFEVAGSWAYSEVTAGEGDGTDGTLPSSDWASHGAKSAYIYCGYSSMYSGHYYARFRQTVQLPSGQYVLVFDRNGSQITAGKGYMAVRVDGVQKYYSRTQGVQLSQQTNPFTATGSGTVIDLRNGVDTSGGVRYASGYWDNLRIRIYSATPPAALAFSGEQETAAPPVTAFTATPSAGLAPLTVQFTDTSTGRPTSWAWTFGDGGTSTAQNPQHTYTTPGTYTVNLTATNEYGSDQETKTNYITVYGPVSAQFSANVTGGTAPLTVQFTDLSTGDPTTWSWNFGDGNTSTAQNPQHTYTTAGTHTVTLTASHPYDSDTETKTAYITVAVLQPFPGLPLIPRDLTGNGLYTDINGNNRLDYNDLTVFFQHLAWAKTAQPTACFDFNGNGWLDYNDVITLFSIITEEHP